MRRKIVLTFKGQNGGQKERVMRTGDKGEREMWRTTLFFFNVPVRKKTVLQKKNEPA